MTVTTQTRASARRSLPTVPETGHPMRTVSVRTLAAHKVRLALTVLSVVLGTAFIAGSFVFTDTLGHTFHGIFAGVAQGVDVQVSAKDGDGSGVPLGAIDTVRAIPGVRAAQAAVGGQIVLLGSDGRPVHGGGAPSEGSSYAAPGQTVGEPYRFIAGTAPTRDGQIALNKGAMALAHLAVGGHTEVLVPSAGAVPVTVTGVYDTKTDTGGYIGALFSHDQALSLFTDGRHVATVNIAGDGISQTVLRDRIAAALPGELVKTGKQVSADTQAQVDKALSFITYFLLAFGAIALLVGTFIIYNTFSMIVAQRLRELALLRALGASRRQVSRSVLFEAVIVGVIGSAVGIAAGLGLAYALRAVLDDFNVGLPSGPLQLTVRTVIVALIVGIGVTVFSAHGPARRASKVPPVAAMRSEFAPTGSSLRVRTATGAAFAVLGALSLVAGAASKSGGGAAGLVGLGALSLTVGVLLAAPALSRPVLGIVGAPIAAVSGAIGRLARCNAVRNPRRTAATAFALTLGLMLVTAIAVFGSSAKKSIDVLVDNGVRADYILTGPSSIGVPIGVAGAIAAVPGVATTTSLEPVNVSIDGSRSTGTGVRGSLPAVGTIDVLSGTLELTGHHIAAADDEARKNGWRLGSTVVMVSADGAELHTTVTALYRHSNLLGSWLASDQLYTEVTPTNRRADLVVLVKAAPGTDLAALRGELVKATDPFLVVNVQDREQFKGSQAGQINGVLAVLYGLLALAIVIAALGIVNTLALSVVERRREIGMLRAVGMFRAQVRRTIYLESALIASFGALLGVGLGLLFGTLFVRTLRDQGLEHLAIPVGQSVVVLVLSATIGVLAALWPAVRAARTRPLEAIAEL